MPEMRTPTQTETQTRATRAAPSRDDGDAPHSSTRRRPSPPSPPSRDSRLSATAGVDRAAPLSPASLWHPRRSSLIDPLVATLARAALDGRSVAGAGSASDGSASAAASVRHSLLHVVLPLVIAQFPAPSPPPKRTSAARIPGHIPGHILASRSVQAAQAAVAAINFSICLEAAWLRDADKLAARQIQQQSPHHAATTSSFPPASLVAHSRRVRLVLLALLVLLCRRTDREKLLAVFTSPVLQSVPPDTGASWTIATVSDVLCHAFVSLVNNDAPVSASIAAAASSSSPIKSIHSPQHILQSQPSWSASLAWLARDRLRDFILVLRSLAGTNNDARLPQGLEVAESFMRRLLRQLAVVERSCQRHAQFLVLLSIYGDYLHLVPSAFHMHMPPRSIRILSHPLLLIKHTVLHIMRISVWHPQLIPHANHVLRKATRNIRNYACEWADASAYPLALIVDDSLLADTCSFSDILADILDASLLQENGAEPSTKRANAGRADAENEQLIALTPMRLDSGSAECLANWATRCSSHRIVKLLLLPLISHLAQSEINWSVCQDLILRLLGEDISTPRGVPGTTLSSQQLQHTNNAVNPWLRECVSKWLVTLACNRSTSDQDNEVVSADVSASMSKHSLASAAINTRAFAIRTLGTAIGGDRSMASCIVSLFDDASYQIRVHVGAAMASVGLNFPSADPKHTSCMHRLDGSCCWKTPRKSADGNHIRPRVPSPFAFLLSYLDQQVFPLNAASASTSNSSGETLCRERETIGLWAYHLTRHIWFLCPIFGIYAIKADTSVHLRAVTAFVEELLNRLALLQSLDATNPDVPNLGVSTDQQSPSCSRRLMISSLCGGMLEGSWTLADIIARNQAVTPPFCDLDVLRVCMPLLQRLRRDASVSVRTACVEICAHLVGASVGNTNRGSNPSTHVSPGDFTANNSAMPSLSWKDPDIKALPSLASLYKIVRGECTDTNSFEADQNSTTSHVQHRSMPVSSRGSVKFVAIDDIDRDPNFSALCQSVLVHGQQYHLPALTMSRSDHVSVPLKSTSTPAPAPVSLKHEARATRHETSSDRPHGPTPTSPPRTKDRSTSPILSSPIDRSKFLAEADAFARALIDRRQREEHASRERRQQRQDRQDRQHQRDVETLRRIEQQRQTELEQEQSEKEQNRRERDTRHRSRQEKQRQDQLHQNQQRQQGQGRKKQGQPQEERQNVPRIDSLVEEQQRQGELSHEQQNADIASDRKAKAPKEVTTHPQSDTHTHTAGNPVPSAIPLNLTIELFDDDEDEAEMNMILGIYADIEHQMRRATSTRSAVGTKAGTQESLPLLEQLTNNLLARSRDFSAPHPRLPSVNSRHNSPNPPSRTGTPKNDRHVQQGIDSAAGLSSKNPSRVFAESDRATIQKQSSDAHVVMNRLVDMSPFKHNLSRGRSTSSTHHQAKADPQHDEKSKHNDAPISKSQSNGDVAQDAYDHPDDRGRHTPVPNVENRDLMAQMAADVAASLASRHTQNAISDAENHASSTNLESGQDKAVHDTVAETAAAATAAAASVHALDPAIDQGLTNARAFLDEALKFLRPASVVLNTDNKKSISNTRSPSVSSEAAMAAATAAISALSDIDLYELPEIDNETQGDDQGTQPQHTDRGLTKHASVESIVEEHRAKLDSIEAALRLEFDLPQQSLNVSLSPVSPSIDHFRGSPSPDIDSPFGEMLRLSVRRVSGALNDFVTELSPKNQQLPTVPSLADEAFGLHQDHLHDKADGHVKSSDKVEQMVDPGDANASLPPPLPPPSQIQQRLPPVSDVIPTSDRKSIAERMSRVNRSSATQTDWQLPSTAAQPQPVPSQSHPAKQLPSKALPSPFVVDDSMVVEELLTVDDDAVGPLEGHQAARNELDAFLSTLPRTPKLPVPQLDPLPNDAPVMNHHTANKPDAATSPRLSVADQIRLSVARDTIASEPVSGSAASRTRAILAELEAEHRRAKAADGISAIADKAADNNGGGAVHDDSGIVRPQLPSVQQVDPPSHGLSGDQRPGVQDNTVPDRTNTNRDTDQMDDFADVSFDSGTGAGNGSIIIQNTEIVPNPLVRSRLFDAVELVLRHLVFSKDVNRREPVDYYRLYKDGLALGSTRSLAILTGKPHGPRDGMSSTAKEITTPGDAYSDPSSSESSSSLNSNSDILIREPLHPILKDVFRLDHSLFLSACDGVSVPFVSDESKSKLKQWLTGLSLVHQHLLPISRTLARLEQRMHAAVSLAQALVIVRDQLAMQRIASGVGLSVAGGSGLVNGSGALGGSTILAAGGNSAVAGGGGNTGAFHILRSVMSIDLGAGNSMYDVRQSHHAGATRLGASILGKIGNRDAPNGGGVSNMVTASGAINGTATATVPRSGSTRAFSESIGTTDVSSHFAPGAAAAATTATVPDEHASFLRWVRDAAIQGQ